MSGVLFLKKKVLQPPSSPGLAVMPVPQVYTQEKTHYHFYSSFIGYTYEGLCLYWCYLIINSILVVLICRTEGMDLDTTMKVVSWRGAWGRIEMELRWLIE